MPYERMPARLEQAPDAVGNQEKCTDLNDPSGSEVVCHRPYLRGDRKVSNSSSMKTEESTGAKKIVETERLVLREMTTADAPLMLELLNEPAFIEYVADRGVRTTVQAAEYIAEKILPSYTRFGFGFYVVELKDSGTSIGMCGLIKRETMEDVDIGFSILERFWGHGYATEAAAAVMNHALTAHRLPRVVAVTAPENFRSMAVLQKIGLRFEKMISLPGYTFESRLFS